MKLGIIGCGAIGSDVALAAEEMDEIDKIFLYDINKKCSERLNKKISKGEIRTVESFLKDVDVVFEAASQEAVNEYAKPILKAGKDLVLMSVGSLFDGKFRRRLAEIAREKNSKIYLPVSFGLFLFFSCIL